MQSFFFARQTYWASNLNSLTKQRFAWGQGLIKCITYCWEPEGEIDRSYIFCRGSPLSFLIPSNSVCQFFLSRLHLPEAKFLNFFLIHEFRKMLEICHRIRTQWKKNVLNYNMVNLLPDWSILSTGKARRKISSHPKTTGEYISLKRRIVPPLLIIHWFYIPCAYVIFII